MSAAKKPAWYRVIDPLNPLFGCDVTGQVEDYGRELSDERLNITGMRRIDMMVGNRPFQLRAKDGETLGLTIDMDQLDESPVQDDIIEMGTESPFGKCLNESEMTRGDGCTLTIIDYEQCIQCAVLQDGALLAAKTRWHAPGGERVTFDGVIGLFESGVKSAQVATLLQTGD